MGFFHHCQPNRRFNSYTAESFPNGPTTWHTIDWDQRRFISTSIPGEVDLADSDEVEACFMHALAGCIDQLDADVKLVKFSIEGDLISTSSDPNDDTSYTPLYCSINMIPDHYRRHGVVSRTELVEVDRLSPCVDLVSYRSQPGSRAVFKYQFHFSQALRNWHELNCWMRLSGHPNIVPFDRLVTDYEEVPGLGTFEVVVGFTSVFVPGKTMEDKPTRPFKFKYLEQLLGIIDDLNLKFGIVHQDVAPRNLLVDPVTDSLQIFDFSCSEKLGMSEPTQFSNYGSFKPDLNAVVATVYGIITRDTQLAEQILQDAGISIIEHKD